MTKKILALVLVTVLALGTLTLSASAAGDSDAYEVGYAKVDINPYWHQWQTYSKGKTFGSDSTIGTAGTAWPHAGQIPEAYQDFYSAYDMVPLPMGGYGNNDTRLSRPKLMDDNGSGVGAGTVNRTAKTSDYYKNSSGNLVRATAGSTYGALFSDTMGTLVADYQDVHLSDNRYTQAFAKKFLGEEGAATYYKTAGGWGENDGDGVWASCVYVDDPQSDSPLLIISLDNIGMADSLVNIAKDRIMKKVSGLSADRIMINSNHTHGSISLGSQYNVHDTETFYVAENYFGDDISFNYQEMWCFLNFYKNFVCNQLAEAALAAYNDRETALTMEKGAIDASEQTGYQLNGVRHNVQTFTGTSKGAVTYVRGSSFNNDVNGDGYTDPHAGGSVSVTTATKGTFSKSEPVTASNDRLQILKFTFENKEPIAMVNFRAHSTANNKEAPKMLHYNISADWVSPLRYDMENAKTLGFDDTDYRFSLLYGNSGNLGTGLSNGDGDPIISSYANYVQDRDGVSRWQLPATPYGRAIAQAALALLNNDTSEDAILEEMHAVQMGPIVSVSRSFTRNKQQWTDLQYAAALKYQQTVTNNTTKTITLEDGETATNGTYSITVETGGSYTIASKYHASRLISTYNTEAETATIELNAFRLGNAVAFSTNSVEASDRYFAVPENMSTSAVPADTVNALNDWDKLVNASWGVPFDLSLTNGANGYIPNSLAFDYNSDVSNGNYTMAIGSYESHSSYSERGTGELMVQALSEMMTEIQPSITGKCLSCGTEKEWLPLTQGVYNNTAIGHYYLDGNYTDADELTVPAGTTVCLELNGATLTATGRAFTVNGTLNIQDSQTGGTVQGTAVDGKNGGTVYVAKNGTVNQHSGILTCDHTNENKLNAGGVVYVAADGSYTMHDGTVTGGKATNGGNVCVAADAEFVLDGGAITAGNATTAGGNVYTYGIFTMNGGSISGGNATSYGGNVHAQGASAVFTMTGGSVSGGAGSSNICTGPNKTDDTSTFRMEGGSVTGTVYVQGKAVLTGTTNGTVNITSKVPSERLTIEGAYTGTINLTVHGVSSFAPGDKIGNATNNADISGATIKVSGAATTQHVEIVGNELRMGGKVVTGISVDTEKVKTTYKLGEALDTTGLVVNYVYSDGSTEVIADGYTVTGYDPAVTGTQTVTVTYGEYTTTFDVHVKVLASIAVQTPPTKTEYAVGEELVTDGLTLTAIYDDGSEETVTEGFLVTGFDSSAAGEKTVTVEYQGCTTTFTVTVAEVTYPYYVDGVGFTDLDKAMEASSSQYPVVLNTDVTGMTLIKNLYLDLNGHDVASVTTGEFKLYCLDSVTDDFEATEAECGKVPVDENILAYNDYRITTDDAWDMVANGQNGKKYYLSVEDGNGKQSFHRLQMEIYAVNVDTSEYALSYTAYFKADSVVKSQIKEFGIAMRAYAQPNQTSIWADADQLTHYAMKQDEWMNGTKGVKGVRVTNILDKNKQNNAARGEVDIFGRCYIQFNDDTMLFSPSINYSMRTFMEAPLEAAFNGLDADEKDRLAVMYGEFYDVIGNWNCPNLDAYYQEKQGTGMTVAN